MRGIITSKLVISNSIPHSYNSVSNELYNSAMGRRLTRPRPKQGAHLAQLRKVAGLSQAELARTVGESQGNIAFWEVSAKPPRSDVLPKLAKALGVSIEDILVSDSAISANKIRSQKTGPTGKLRKLFEEASKLPRHQQDKICEFLSIFLKQFKLSKQAGQDRQDRQDRQRRQG
jgi:transcriptional regulator with XRE-family HTH domain